jgi:hypothetical protein
MNMLKMEENAKYRTVIKNILEFDPRIIQRFTNFMNNPDEETAVAQFGKGDKYFGVAMMMVTMPGLPMFGHGQIEGFTEKYGMEFSRAQWNEIPDEDLIRRHEAELFPLMRMRHLFSGAENFVLYDFYTESGAVNEDVFAYSNQRGADRALVIYHNKFEATRGWIRDSAAMAVDDGTGGRTLIHKTLAEGLHLNPKQNIFSIFRDRKSNLEYIRRNNRLVDQGMYVELHAYQYYVFTGFREVQDDAAGLYGQLCDRLGGQGVPSIDEAYREMRYEPLLNEYRAWINADSLRKLVKASNYQTAARKFVANAKGFLTQAGQFGGGKQELKQIASEIEDLVQAALNLKRVNKLKKKRQSEATQAVFDELLTQIPKRADATLSFWRIALGYCSVCQLGKLRSNESYAEQGALWYEEWLLNKALAQVFSNLGCDDYTAWRESKLIKLLVAQHEIAQTFSGIRKHAEMARLLDDPEVQSYLGVHLYQGVQYFHKESYEQLARWLELVTLLHTLSNKRMSKEQKLRYMIRTHTTFSNISLLALVAEYQLDKFKTLLGYAVGSEKSQSRSLVPTAI